MPAENTETELALLDGSISAEDNLSREESRNSGYLLLLKIQEGLIESPSAQIHLIEEALSDKRSPDTVSVGFRTGSFEHGYGYTHWQYDATYREIDDPKYPFYTNKQELSAVSLKRGYFDVTAGEVKWQESLELSFPRSNYWGSGVGIIYGCAQNDLRVGVVHDPTQNYIYGKPTAVKHGENLINILRASSATASSTSANPRRK